MLITIGKEVIEMAIRNIRILGEEGDDVLKKAAKEVKEVTPRIKELIADMFDTMHDAFGVGLAAPQVGVRKKVVVIEIEEVPYVLINPVILEVSGEQTGPEGCLSVPGKTGTVTRPNYVKVKAFNEDMEEYIIEGTELLARCLCHEIDHLDGIMYVDKIEGELEEDEFEEDDVNDRFEFSESKEKGKSLKDMKKEDFPSF